METLKLIGTILGGLGLFLLAVGMMTDGLKLAAGKALQHLLSEWTRTPARGIFSGFLMTAIVQSSSAVTVATLGFVNAGLLSMRHALGIIYGSNVGTTMTGWLVALVGFKVNIQAFALPLIGLGMIMKLIQPKGRASSIGLALVGFGLFFVGIDILKGAFEGFVSTFDISEFDAEGVRGVLLFLGIGFIMTVLTQSSSASIALTITAASSEIVGLYAAGAMVIGANIGTTSTALLASIGATANAKRVAAAQVTFNVLTALVALIILPILFYLIDETTKLLNIEADTAISLALFHTVFNILGVLLIYPLNNRIASFLESRYRTYEETVSRPQFLHKTIAQTPSLAVNAVFLELISLSDKVANLFVSVTPKIKRPTQDIEQEISAIKSLSSAVSHFIVNVESSALNQETTSALETLMRVDQYFLTCTLTSETLLDRFQARESISKAELEEQVQDFFRHAVAFMHNASIDGEVRDDELQQALKKLSDEHDATKANLIMAATRSKISITQMTQNIDCLADVLLVSKQWLKAFSRIHELERSMNLSRDKTLSYT